MPNYSYARKEVISLDGRIAIEGYPVFVPEWQDDK